MKPIDTSRLLEVLREDPLRANMPDDYDRETLIAFVVGDLHQAHARIARLEQLVEAMRVQGAHGPYRLGG